MQTNQLMNRILRTHRRYLKYGRRGESSARVLDAILENGISRAHGGYFLTALLAKRSNAKPADFPDMTGYECFVNHLHLSGARGGLYTLAAAIKFSEALRTKLSACFPAGKFKIIISFTEDEANVRFHLSRVNENWLSENIDGYREAILVLESNDARSPFTAGNEPNES